MLRAGVMQDGAVHREVTGTPQGGVLSPVLGNVYLHRVDRQWSERGTGVLVRYADDLVVLCHSQREADAGAGVAAVDPGRARAWSQGGQDPDRAPTGGRRGL